MKKKGLVLLCLSLSLIMCTGCATFSHSNPKSISTYQEEITKIASGHHYTVQKSENLKDSPHDFIIDLNNDSELVIDFSNSEKSQNDYSESFEISYTISKDNTEFDLALFSELSSLLSEETLTEDFCRGFLEAPESQYAPEEYGLSKTEEMTQYKLFYPDFWQDHCLSYTQYNDGTAELIFSGEVADRE